MLTQLSTLKARLAIDPIDLQYDEILTNTLNAISVRFDNETNRTLAHTVNSAQEFDASDTEICLACYPVESVSKFELKSSEAEGWIEQTGVEYLIRRGCILSLTSPISYLPSGVPRVTYTGGYVLPGTTPSAGQIALPSDLESACVEQAAAWFLHRDKVGLQITWPKGGTYESYITTPFLPIVQSVLDKYRRFTI